MTKFDNKNYSGVSNADPGLVLKNSHNPDKQSLDVSDAEKLITSKYDIFYPTYDSNGNPTKIIYGITRLPQITTIAFQADIAGSLNSKYFLINSGNNNKSYYVWYNVSGTGVNPNIPNKTGLMVAINTNDPSNVVTLATQFTLQATGDWTITRIESTLVIENTENGVASPSSNGNTSFILSTTQTGTYENVGEVNILYDSLNNPIWKGQTLIGHRFNIFTCKFELNTINLASPVQYTTHWYLSQILIKLNELTA